MKKSFTVYFIKKIIGWIMFLLIWFFNIAVLMVAEFKLENINWGDYIVPIIPLILCCFLGVVLLLQTSKEKIEITENNVVKKTMNIEEKKLDQSNIKRLILVRAQTQFGNKRKTHIVFDDGTYKQGEQIDTSQSRVGKTWIVMECSKKRLRYIKNAFSTVKIEEDVREVFDGFPINTLFDVKKNIENK